MWYDVTHSTHVPKVGRWKSCQQLLCCCWLIQQRDVKGKEQREFKLAFLVCGNVALVYPVLLNTPPQVAQALVSKVMYSKIK
jgi:hypothetical protein